MAKARRGLAQHGCMARGLDGGEWSGAADTWVAAAAAQLTFPKSPCVLPVRTAKLMFLLPDHPTGTHLQTQRPQAGLRPRPT